MYTWRRAGEVLSVAGDLRWPMFQAAKRRPVRAGQSFGLLTITARNRGRTPVEVHRLWLASKDMKKRSSFRPAPPSASIPVTIEARNRVKWFVSPESLGVLTKQHGNPLVVRPLIEWGPGNWKRGRVLRIRVGEEFLPVQAPRFKSSAGYWFRTLRPKKGVGPYEWKAIPPILSTPQAGDAGSRDRDS